MSEKEYQKSGQYKVNVRWMLFVPIILLLGVIPMVVQLVKVDVPDERVLYLTNNNVDMFSQAKSTLIMVVIGIILLATFLSYNKQYIKVDKISKIYYISSAVFVLMTVVATFMSEYSRVAKWGLPNRAEGMVMIVCYIIMMLYTFNVFRKTGDYKYLIVPLTFLVLALTVLGYYQYKGEDLLMTEWGKKIIIPEHYAEDRALLQPLYADKNIYGTFNHYNYVGSFAAMVVPFFTLLACFLKDYKWKIVCGVVSICSVFLLFGSTARSGLIGLGCSMVVALILLSSYLVKRWKVTLGVVVVGILIVVGLDTVTKGAIFSRLPALLEDVVQLMQPVDTTVDYKETLPVKGISHEAGSVIIDLGQEKLKVSVGEEGLEFADAQGEKVVYIYMNLGEGNEQYFTQDTRFEPYKFLMSTEEGQLYARLFYKETYVGTLSAADEVHLVQHFTKEPIELVEPEAIGFKGKEKIGSSRGYIWSRSLPLLKETFLVGTGPDTFGFYFPQDDLLGKWYAYGDPNIVVDKPHNLYLQIALQQGGIALVAFLILIGTYLVQSFRLYALRKDYEEKHIVGIALMLAVVGYLGAGIFNDSVVSVAPIFWVLLGAGMGINYLIKEDKIKDEKQKPYGTIHMKTRKHM